MKSIINNSLIINIEGIDRSGKDTLRDYLNSKINYYYPINVRGVISHYVYTKYFNRVANPSYYQILEDEINKKIANNELIILLTITKDEYKRRCEATKHQIDDNIMVVQQMFIDLLKDKKNVMIFENASCEEVANEIFVNEH